MTESKMPPSTSVLLVLACVLPVIWGHSQLSDPQSTAPMVSEFGGLASCPVCVKVYQHLGEACD